MSESKQTAVEWLVGKLKESGIPLLIEELEMIKQAKAMEKEQIIKSYDCTNSIAMNGEQYYNETFKSE